MTLKDKAIADNAIMTITKTDQIRHVIANTDKGDFCLTLRKGQSELEYRFVLDAVPFDDKDNADLLKIFDDVIITA